MKFNQVWSYAWLTMHAAKFTERRHAAAMRAEIAAWQQFQKDRLIVCALRQAQGWRRRTGAVMNDRSLIDAVTAECHVPRADAAAAVKELGGLLKKLSIELPEREIA